MTIEDDTIPLALVDDYIRKAIYLIENKYITTVYHDVNELALIIYKAEKSQKEL
tara:strand:- start:456 stop:617 length:162 start_codon:yes stop_codon:yes gene_type:complete